MCSSDKGVEREGYQKQPEEDLGASTSIVVCSFHFSTRTVDEFQIYQPLKQCDKKITKIPDGTVTQVEPFFAPFNGNVDLELYLVELFKCCCLVMYYFFLMVNEFHRKWVEFQ